MAFNNIPPYKKIGKKSGKIEKLGIKSGRRKNKKNWEEKTKSGFFFLNRVIILL